MGQGGDASGETRYDMLLTGGRVIDVTNGIDAVCDVAILDGKVTAVGKALDRAAAEAVIDVTGKLVTPGLIDTHAHIFEHVAGKFGLNPDQVGLRSGISTLIDQGGPSCLTLQGFRKFVAEPAQTDVRCFLSTYLAGGLAGHIFSDLYGPEQISVDATVKSIEANRDIVCGLKSHAEPGHYSRWGLAVLEKSKLIARAAGVPTYVHLGTLWPVRDGVRVDPLDLLREMVPLMDAGDILAHPFTRHPSGFTGADGKVHPIVFEARDRGLLIDVGRGNHFSIKVARQVLDSGILPDTLGADLHGYNISPASAGQGATDFAGANAGRMQEGMAMDVAGSEDPAFSLFYAMSEMLALGIPLAHLVAMVTINAARMAGLDGSLGCLSVGRTANIAVLDLQRGHFVMTDGVGETMTSNERIRPFLALHHGALVHPSSEYLPFWEREAA